MSSSGLKKAAPESIQMVDLNAPPKAPPSIKGRRDFYPVLFGGVILTLVAGFINATMLSSVYKRAVTHMTGTTTKIATSLIGIKVDYHDVYQCIIIILCFTLGSMVCGFLIGSDREFKRVRAYGTILVRS